MAWNEVEYKFVASDLPILNAFESITATVRQALISGAEESCRMISKLWDVHDADVVWRALLRMQAGDKNEYSLLHVAAASGRKEIIEAVSSGRNPADDPTDPQRKFLKFDFLHARTSRGQTALHYAVFSHTDDILELLMRTYDEILVEEKRPQNPWFFADCCWMTPLHYAVVRNQKAKMELLLRWEFYRKHVNARDFFRRTPLHLAACHRPVSVEHFLKCERVDINAVDCIGHSPLHWAVCFGRADVVKCFSSLEESRTTFDAIDVDIEGRSILELAEDDDVLGESLDSDLGSASQDPLFCDSLYVMGESTITHKSVGGTIERMLLTIPVMDREKQRLDESLQLYTNLISTIFVVAALVGSATYGVQVTNLAASQSAKDSYLFLNMVAFYVSLVILTLGVGALYYSRKASRGQQHMKRTDFMVAFISGALGVSLFFFMLAFYNANWTALYHSPPKLIVYHMLSMLGIFVCYRIFDTIRTKFAFVEKDKPYRGQPMDVIPPYANEQSFSFCGVYPCYRGWSRLSRNAFQAHEIFLRVRAYAIRPSVQLETKGAELTDNLEEAWHMENLKKVEPEANVRGNLIHFLREISDFQRSPERLEDSTSKEEPNVPLFWTLAVNYWRQRRVLDVTIHLFARMERKLQHVESVYKRFSKDLGDTRIAGELARHLTSFLDRLPHGILYWINTWTFPTDRSAYISFPLPQLQGKSLAFLLPALTQACFQGKLLQRPSRIRTILSEWFDHVLGEVVEPLKFALVPFYQGHVLRIDFVKMCEVRNDVASCAALASTTRTSATPIPTATAPIPETT